MSFVVVLAVPRVSPIGGRVVCPQPDDAGALRRVEDTTELIAGVEHRGITLAPHDPAWAGRLAVEQSRIRATLSDRAVRADHVGSIAVPGLAAKPIVDIDLSVTNVEDESALLPDLLAAGYELRVHEPSHRLLRTPAPPLHVCDAGSEWEHRHLAFRDRLLANKY